MEISIFGKSKTTTQRDENDTSGGVEAFLISLSFIVHNFEGHEKGEGGERLRRQDKKIEINFYFRFFFFHIFFHIQ